MGHNALVEKIRLNNVLVNLNCTSKEEAIVLLADTLFQQGDVKASFRQAVISRENVFPTGLDTGEVCVAIPHTDREHVNRDAIAVATLAEPIEFMAMGSQDTALKIQVIVMLAIASDDRQIETLQAVMNLVQDQSLLKQVTKSKNAEELLNIIS